MQKCWKASDEPPHLSFVCSGPDMGKVFSSCLFLRWTWYHQHLSGASLPGRTADPTWVASRKLLSDLIFFPRCVVKKNEIKSSRGVLWTNLRADSIEKMEDSPGFSQIQWTNWLERLPKAWKWSYADGQKMQVTVLTLVQQISFQFLKSCLLLDLFFIDLILSEI